MAHCDYSCCGICDNKVTYGDYPAKTAICSWCASEFGVKGIRIRDCEELINWMETETPEKVLTLLTELNFSKCCYRNDVDILYDKIKENYEKETKS